MVDQLAAEYAARSVAFLENDVDYPLGNRLDRWFAGYSGTFPARLPVAMVSSGHVVWSGVADYHSVYGAMVEGEMARPPEAEVEAYGRRIGDAMRVYVRVVNGCPAVLSRVANDATVHALVWEDKKVGVSSRTIRAAPSKPLDTELAPGEALNVTLETPLLHGVDWDRLHAVALLDYRPAGLTGAYDMLQAALAAVPDLEVAPESLSAQLRLESGDDLVGTVALRGPHVLRWEATTDDPWLGVTPDEGSVPSAAEVRVRRELLSIGVHRGMIAFTATSPDDLAFSCTVDVTVELRSTSSRMRRRGVLRSVPAP